MAEQRVSFLFPIAGRQARLDDIKKGQAPADFFYGGLALEKELGSVHYVDLRKDPTGSIQKSLLFAERMRNRFANFGLTKQRISAFANDFSKGDLILSFTDSGSISIGRYRHLLPENVTLAGGFHGLCDMNGEAASWARGWATKEIRTALNNLDHCFFFGERDREEAIKRYGLEDSKTSVFPFGIDLDFWKPGADEDCERDGTVFAVGSDPKRDYANLIKAAEDDLPTRILTRLNLELAANQKNIELVRGSLHGSAITDVVLRDLYWQSEMVIVPVRDVVQPSGYSVSLQAMACGKPTIISDIKGLWDRSHLHHGENCILVPPGDAVALRKAILQLRNDKGLRQTIGQAARETSLAHFGLERMNTNLSSMVANLRKTQNTPGES